MLSTGPESSSRQVDEVYLIYTPLARTDLRNVIFSEMPYSDRGTIFGQLIDALKHIHNYGIVHRDIKPDNVIIISFFPPISQIIDFGHATNQLEHMRDHMKGTVKYLAPEVIALKQGTSKARYSKAIDIWALGVSAWELLFRQKIKWEYITPKHFTDMKELLWIPQNTNTSVNDLIESMLRLSATHRISAADALCEVERLGIYSTSPQEVKEAITLKRKVVE